MDHISVKVDRVQVVSWAPQGKPPLLKGFKVTRDSFVRPQTNIPSYARCRQYQSTSNDTKLYWQYYRRSSFLKPWKITVVADDKSGLSYDELDNVLGHCRFWHYLTVEVAFDFSPSTAVNGKFVRRHVLVGKSRRRRKHQTEDVLYFGTRKSDKFVRCYEKKAVDCYRVELELHSQLLRREHISTLEDLDRLQLTIYPKHFQFVCVDWDRLERHLTQKHHSQALIAGARKRGNSLSRVRRYLGRHRIRNFHRFLLPLAINKRIERAFTRWTDDFKGMP